MACCANTRPGGFARRFGSVDFASGQLFRVHRAIISKPHPNFLFEKRLASSLHASFSSFSCRVDRSALGHTPSGQPLQAFSPKEPRLLSEALTAGNGLSIRPASPAHPASARSPCSQAANVATRLVEPSPLCPPLPSVLR
jgi:hypothetical protein